MKPIKQEYQYNRPAIFDWMVFTLSFLLGFIFPGLGDFVRSPAFAWWMLAVLVFYIAGAWLKHIPLSHRLQRPNSKNIMGYVIFLVTGHWCIILFVTILAARAIFQLLGFKNLSENNSAGSVFVFIAMILSSVVTWMVYRNKTLPRSYKPKPDYYLFRRELVADIFMVLSVSVLTFAIWEKGIMAMLSNKTVGSLSEVWFLFIILSITYLLLYLPLRYLYLVEDRGGGRWKRMMLIFAFLLLRSLFEIIRG
jgi:hypothetical protein